MKNYIGSPPPPPPEAHPFARGVPPRARSFFPRSAISGVTIDFRGKNSLCNCGRMAAPNHSGFSEPRLSRQELAGDLKMPDDLSGLFDSNDVDPAAVLHPGQGSLPSSLCRDKNAGEGVQGSTNAGGDASLTPFHVPTVVRRG